MHMQDPSRQHVEDGGRCGARRPEGSPPPQAAELQRLDGLRVAVTANASGEDMAGKAMHLCQLSDGRSCRLPPACSDSKLEAGPASCGSGPQTPPLIVKQAATHALYFESLRTACGTQLLPHKSLVATLG